MLSGWALSSMVVVGELALMSDCLGTIHRMGWQS